MTDDGLSDSNGDGSRPSRGQVSGPGRMARERRARASHAAAPLHPETGQPPVRRRRVDAARPAVPPPPDESDPDVKRARRIEFGCYVFTALSLITLGVFLTSKILNWIVGPAYVVVMVSLVTPWVLRKAGVADPDAGSYQRWAATHLDGSKPESKRGQKK